MAGIEGTGKQNYWLEKGEAWVDGRADGSSAIGDWGQAATSLIPDIEGTASDSSLERVASSHLWEFTA